MRKCLCSKASVKCLSISTALALSVHVLVSILIKEPPAPSPLSAHERALVSPRTYRYVHDQPSLCRNTVPFLLLVVPVTPRETEARDVIRRTWGSGSAAGPGEDTRTLFFMGVSKDDGGPPASVDLLEESRTHSDIVQLDFLDTYQNLTIKTVLMMNWIATHCPNATFVMKVDADIFVNVFYLLRWLKSCPHHGFITGSLIRDGKPRRDRNSKWYVSQEQFPEDGFPPYLSGAGYVLSADLAARITWASQFVRFLSMEDVYVGLCLRVLGVRPSYAISLPTLRNLFEVQDREYDRCTFAKIIIVNGFKPSKLLQAWQDFAEGHSRC